MELLSFRPLMGIVSYTTCIHPEQSNTKTLLRFRPLMGIVSYTTLTNAQKELLLDVVSVPLWGSCLIQLTRT